MYNRNSYIVKSFQSILILLHSNHTHKRILIMNIRIIEKYFIKVIFPHNSICNQMQHTNSITPGFVHHFFHETRYKIITTANSCRFHMIRWTKPKCCKIWVMAMHFAEVEMLLLFILKCQFALYGVCWSNQNKPMDDF